METLLSKIRIDYPEVRQGSPETLAAWQDDPERTLPLLFDEREQEEFSVSHLPGAKRARTAEEALALLKTVKKDQPIVVYCSVGVRSSRLAVHLQEQGFTQVYNLEGSIFAWANQNRPLTDKRGKTTLVHPYDSEWGLYLKEESRAPLKK